MQAESETCNLFAKYSRRSRNMDRRNSSGKRIRRCDCVDDEREPVVLPDDIIFYDILPRLPVKSLLRLTCVCKSWSSLIRSNSCFADRHMALSKERTDGGNLLICYHHTHEHYRSGSYFMPASFNGEASKYFVPLINKVSIYMSECVNGLVYLHRRNGTTPPRCPRDKEISASYVWNLSTREIITVPSNIPSDELFSFFMISYSFGYEPVKKEYKVICMRDVRKGDHEALSKMDLHCQIFTLGSKSWRKVDAFFPFDITPNDADLIFTIEGVYANGALHWPVRSKDAILVFDLKDENFRSIPAPPSATKDLFDHGPAVGMEWCQLRNQNLTRISGCLAAIDCGPYDDKMELWILKDDQNQVWSNEPITIPEDARPRKLFPVGTIHTGEILLVPYAGWGLHMWVVYYDRERKTYRRVDIEEQPPEGLLAGNTRIEYIRGYSESLVSLKEFI